VDKDMNGLHVKLNDAVDQRKQREMIREFEWQQ